MVTELRGQPFVSLQFHRTFNPQFDEFIGSAQMRSYADGTVAILVHRANTTGTADSADVSVSGYLIDLP